MRQVIALSMLIFFTLTQADIQDADTSFLQTENEKKPFFNVRLPAHVKPLHYDVVLEVNMQTKEVKGKTRVKILVRKPTSYLFMHAVDYMTLSGKVYNDKKEIIPTSRQFQYEKNQYHVLEFADKIAIANYSLHYEFSYTLKTKLAGFYQAKYKENDGSTKIAAVTQFQPTDARLAFPCFDEPIMRASFDITIGHDKEYIAISNMPIEKSWHDVTGKIKYDKFQRTPVMSTYILSFVVCQFDHVTVTPKTVHPVLMTFYVPPPQLSQIKYAANTGKDILAFYEKFYNVPYPLPKADMIAVPDFALNGMENWGLVSCRMKGLLYDPISSPLTNKEHVNTLIAHELAHQWFGNLVTLDWWSDLWLNEGFATYMTFKGTNAVHPKWKYPDFQIITGMASAMNLDALLSSHPVYVKVENPAQINEIFDAISYLKGGSVLRMLENFLGERTFVSGLNTYLKKYAYGNAKTNDLWDELSKASRLSGAVYNVTKIMNTWVLQKGFPVVDVTRADDGTYKITQNRFLSDPNMQSSESDVDSPYHYKWYIPFNYVTIDGKSNKQKQNSTVKTVWMNMADAKIEVQSKSTIIKGNAGQYGFFRENYDKEGWRNIISTLKDHHQIFDVTDRAGLMQDAFALASSGRLPYSTALSLLDYIGKEADYLPWKAARNSINYIQEVLSQSPRSQNLLKTFLKSKISKLYDQFGFKKETDFLKRYLQVLIAELACEHGHPKCLKKSSGMFREWMNKGKAITPDFKKLVYYHGVRTGDEREWNFVLKNYLQTKVPYEKFTLLYALCATQQPDTIDKMLHYTLDPSIIKSQDSFYVFRYIVGNSPQGRYQAWYFLKENWGLIVERFSHQFHTLERIVRDVITGFTTEHALKQVKSFFTEERMVGAEQVKRTLKQSVENVKANVEWLRRNKNLIEKWLEENV